MFDSKDLQKRLKGGNRVYYLKRNSHDYVPVSVRQNNKESSSTFAKISIGH